MLGGFFRSADLREAIDGLSRCGDWRTVGAILRLEAANDFGGLTFVGAREPYQGRALPKIQTFNTSSRVPDTFCGLQKFRCADPSVHLTAPALVRN